MLLALAFGVIVLLNVLVWWVGRRRKGRASEADLEALSPYANFGGLVGAAHVRNSGIGEGLGGEPPVREDTERVRFRLDDPPASKP